jgi:hypothetical protein
MSKKTDSTLGEWLMAILTGRYGRSSADLERFVNLSLDMERHSRGQMFDQAMRTFPTEKFHEWCTLGKKLEASRFAPRE